MKSHLTSFLFVLALALPLSAFAGQEEFIQSPEKVFTPVGLDNNDHAEIVLYGHFPNSCYRAGPATVRVEGGSIVIQNRAYRDTSANCIQMSVPWATTIPLGVLPARSYNIFVDAPTGESQLFEHLEVALSASPEIDDYLYAFVNGVMINTDRTNTATMTLSGSFGVTCMYLKDVTILRNKANVVTVLPIVAFDHTKVCAHPFAPIPFQKTLRIAGPLETRATLFHIRSVNGQALNRVVEY
jgi:hypothetical protein